MKNIKTSNIALVIVVIVIAFGVWKYTNLVPKKDQTASATDSQKTDELTKEALQGIAEIKYDEDGKGCTSQLFVNSYVDIYKGEVIQDKDGTKTCGNFDAGTRYQAVVNGSRPVMIEYGEDGVICYIHEGSNTAEGTVVEMGGTRSCQTINSPRAGNIIQINIDPRDLPEATEEAQTKLSEESLFAFYKGINIDLSDRARELFSTILISPVKVVTVTTPIPPHTESQKGSYHVTYHGGYCIVSVFDDAGHLVRIHNDGESAFGGQVCGVPNGAGGIRIFTDTNGNGGA